MPRRGEKSEKRGADLGLFEEVVYPTMERAMTAGDVLLLFTDGLFE